MSASFFLILLMVFTPVQAEIYPRSELGKITVQFSRYLDKMAEGMLAYSDSQCQMPDDFADFTPDYAFRPRDNTHGSWSVGRNVGATEQQGYICIQAGSGIKHQLAGALASRYAGLIVANTCAATASEPATGDPYITYWLPVQSYLTCP